MRDYMGVNRESGLEAGSNRPAMRRDERINMARSAFGRGERYPMASSYFFRGGGDSMGDEPLPRQSGRFVRLVIAMGLFILFVGLCYFDVSFHGYDRKWLEQCLQDTHLWEQMTGAIADCINRLR